MMLDFAGILREAWRTFRRDADLLLRVAGPFLFLPVFALYLLVPDPPIQPAEATEAAQRIYVQQLADYAGANVQWYVLASLLAYYGVLAVISLYAQPDRPTLGTAMLTALKLFPRYLLAMFVVGMVVFAGAVLLLTTIGLLVPVAAILLTVALVFWLLGRLYPVGPSLVAERPLGAMRAIARSFRRTKGHGIVLAGLSSMTLAAGVLMGQPFLLIDTAMQQAHAANPVALALVDAGAAAASALSLLAMALLQVVAYRRLSGGQE